MTRKALYSPNDESPYKLSRSKVDLFLQCPRCFYLDRRLGISQPSGPPFTLNNAVDSLLKSEFDGYRKNQQVPPFLLENGLEAIPFSHPELDSWRNNRQGIQHLDFQTNFLLYGAIDDVWQLPSGELVIADYKAKATTKEISLTPKRKKNGDIYPTDRYLISYVNQIEFYQWLFRQNGFPVSNTGYFLFANAQKDKAYFNDRLDFERFLITHEGDDGWVEPTLAEIKTCLNSPNIPEYSNSCAFCTYQTNLFSVQRESTHA